jgi:hypothetical protein
VAQQQQHACVEDWVLPLVHGYFKQRTMELATGQVRWSAGLCRPLSVGISAARQAVNGP